MLVSFGLFAGAHAAFGQCQYEVTAVIQAPPCPFTGPPVTIGHAMNESGHVVGRFADCATSFNHAFVWTPEGGFEQLPQPADVIDMVANDINDNQTIVGTWTREDVGTRGFVYDPKTEEYTELPPVLPDGPSSSANAINNSGVVVGSRTTGESISPWNAFVWSTKDGFTDLGLINGLSTAAHDINEDGIISGQTQASFDQRGFVYQDTTLTVLQPIPPGFTTSASSINGKGQVTVSELIKGGGAGGLSTLLFVWNDGTFLPLESIDKHTSLPADINDFGTITGKATPYESSGQPLATLWDDSAIYLLHDLLLTEADFQLKRGVAANSFGQILVQANDDSVIALILEATNRPTGDVTSDCEVDVDDLIALLDLWGQTDSPADIDNNGLVNVSDLLLLLTHWGETF